MPRATKRVSLRAHAKAAKAKSTQADPQPHEDGQSAFGDEDGDGMEDVAETSAAGASGKKGGKGRAVVESKLPEHQKDDSSHPYSRSHTRRVRRRERENPGGSSMSTTLTAALDFLNPSIHKKASTSSTPKDVPGAPPKPKNMMDSLDDLMNDSVAAGKPGKAADREDDGLSRKERKMQKRAERLAAVGAESGKIGEGKGKPLKAQQRNNEVAQNKARLHGVIKNPAFRLNPFEAIRVHAGNTLEMQDREEVQRAVREGKGKGGR